jgi:hypothetical protein
LVWIKLFIPPRSSKPYFLSNFWSSRTSCFKESKFEGI